MIKAIAIAALLSAAPAAAQDDQRVLPNAACAPGTSYATIRHNRIKPGMWRTFEEAIALHNAWYVVQAIKTEVTLVRVIKPNGPGYVAATDEAVTITRYQTDTARPPADPARNAFVTKYEQSAVLTDEMRVCLPTN